MSYRCSGCDVLETLWLRCYDILHIYRRIHFYFIHAHKKVSIWPDMLVCGAELVVDFLVVVCIQYIEGRSTYSHLKVCAEQQR